LKLAAILAQYLYNNKRLTLQGIGMFQSDPSVYVETTNPKTSKSLPAESISFQNDPSAKQDEELVKFISAQTGKMKALAISDLESYIELMQQFLNIGKPFQIEGIGTLTKIRNQEYGFVQGNLLNERITEITEQGKKQGESGEDSSVSFRDLYKKHDKPGFTLKKASIAFLLFGGIGLAIWGGYALYSKNQHTSSSASVTPVQQLVEPAKDSIKYTEKKKLDSLPKKAETNPPGYKFVFESTPNKNRAIKRFNFLKNINSDIHLETTDSSLFKITVDLNIPPSDTLRIKDSLNAWYYGRKDILVKIESNNNTNRNVP
jgi:nucleoid DNA-binding protein